MVYRYRMLAVIAAFIVMLLAIPSGLRAQSWQWANIGSGSQTDIVGGVGVDSVGNTYMVGTFENNISFGATIFTNGANTGLFLVKYNAAGVLQWAVQGIAAPAGNFTTPSLAVTRSGEVFISGGFNGTVRFGTDTLRTTGGYDFFIARFSPAGVRRWVRGDGRGFTNAEGRGIAVDNLLGSYVTGVFSDTARFDTFTVRSNAMADIFVAKYDENGVVRWVSSGGGTTNDEAYGIGVDGVGNSYVAGTFADSAFFATDTITSAGRLDGFVAKFSPTGGATWATSMGGEYDDIATHIAVDQFGNSYLTGSYIDTARFGDSILVNADTTDTVTASTDIFVAKVDGTGGIRWALRAGGEGSDAGLGITIDEVGDVYVTGRYTDSSTFGNVVLADTAGTGEVFVAKYNGSGAFRWVRSGGGPLLDQGRRLAIDRNGELRVAGEFSRTARFGPLTVTATGGLDVFVAKLGSDPTIVIGTIIERTLCPGDQFHIPFTIRGVFETGNVFTAQLSDSSGSFAAPVDIGRVFGIGGTVVIAKVPDSVLPGVNYRVRVVSNMPEAIGNINALPLTIYAAPRPVITPSGPDTICRGETITLDAGAGFGTYLWVTGETTRTINVNRAGDFTVTVTNQNGCSSTSAPVRITMVTAARPVITKTGAMLESTPAVTYQWSFNGAPLSGATSRTLTPTQAGAYTVSITDSNGCTAVSDAFNFTTTGVPEELAAGGMALYPHPNTGLFTLSLRLPHSGVVKASVVNAAGREVSSWSEHGVGGEYSRRVDIRNEPAGLYFVRIELGDKQWIREVIKR